MCENEDLDNYVSYIKVKGIHLLPPLITPKYRSQLQRYKQQAVKLEKRLQNCRELKKNLEDILNCQPLLDRPESEITFRDNSHVEHLGISEKVPVRKRNITLSRDIIDVTEYTDEGIKIMDYESNANDLELKQEQLINLNNASEDYETDTSQLITNKVFDEHSDVHCPSLDLSEIVYDIPKTDKIASKCSSPKCEVIFKVTSPTTPKPRLIRSNSYTLDSPSPILLAHLNKSKTKINNEKPSELNNISFSRHWSSLENNYIPFENSEPSSINTVYYNDVNNFENVENNPIIEVVKTDISVQQITVNTDERNRLITSKFDLLDPESKLMQVLSKIPEDCSKQIIELIEKQKLENVNNNVENVGNKINYRNYEYNFENESPYPENLLSRTSDSISPSESLQYSISTSDTLAPSSPLKLINNEHAEESPKNNVEEFFVNTKSKTPVNRELLPELNAATVETMKQEWAASIIGAYVKGYLTRRILKTEKVQSLIETIKDALLCALQLHTADNIDESDVELHRRLINQVSAACYAFHDIFFSLTVREQMTMISMDRQRKIEKAKRPLSAHTPRSSRTSSRSSTKQLTPHSRSLTKV